MGCKTIDTQTTSEAFDVVFVRVPPYFDPRLTDGENHCTFSYWRHPPLKQNVDISTLCKGAGLPNDDSILSVSLREDKSLALNSEPIGSISNLKPLKDRLTEIFEARRENGVFEEGSEKIEKSVGLQIPVSARYNDAFKIARTVKESGADPIILLLDGHLPQQVISITNPTFKK